MDKQFVVPKSEEAERTVLGVILKYPDLVDTVIGKLDNADFTNEQLRHVWNGIIKLKKEGKPISFIQLAVHLSREGIDNAFLVELTEVVISKSELEPAVKILKDTAGKRALLNVTGKIDNMIYSGAMELDELKLQAQKLIFDVTRPEDVAGAKHIMEVLQKSYKSFYERQEGMAIPGLNVGFDNTLHLYTRGLRKKDLVIIAGRPSMGKTAFALNCLYNAAKQGKPGLFVSLEMDDEQVADRLIVMDAKVRGDKFAFKVAQDELERINQSFSRMSELPIYISDTRGLGVDEIISMARELKTIQPDLSHIWIDYLTLIARPRDGRRDDQKLGEMVRRLRDEAGRLDLPIIVLSQLNRGLEKRDNKRPVMADLRESGEIEEFADVIMFLYRDEYYSPDLVEARYSKDVVEVILAKQRKGQTGTVLLEFNRDFMRFNELSEDRESLYLHNRNKNQGDGY